VFLEQTDDVQAQKRIVFDHENQGLRAVHKTRTTNAQFPFY